MGIPLFDLMNYGMGLATIASAPAHQAFLLAQGVAYLELDTEAEVRPDAATASAPSVEQAAPPERSAA